MSSYLYADRRLGREQLREISAAGFDAIELFALRTHVDYHNESAIANLQQDLADARLVLDSVHAPISESATGRRSGALLNLASPDGSRREHAVDEALHALHIARRLPFSVLVVHPGVPRAQQQTPVDNNRDAARRSIETLATAAEPLGVTVAVELIPNALSKPESLVYFIEDVLEAGAASICLDMGHAHLGGEVVDAIETVSEHIAAVHAHDNRGREDEHLLPFEGTIDWPAALTTLQKVGYEAPIVLELASKGSTPETLARASVARRRMEQLLTTL
jgi:sugar phosphate isomerase/epimerase